MLLIKCFTPKSQARFLTLLSIVWIGLQLKAYYWLLAVILVVVRPGLIQSCRACFFFTRQAFLSSFLLIFTLALFFSAVIDFGLKGLLSELPVVFPLLPIFVFSSVGLWQRKNGAIFESQYVLYSFSIGFLTALGAILSGLHLSDSPASSLRPLEVQASSGIFFMTAIFIAASFRSSVNHLKSHRSYYFGLSAFILSALAFVCFRGLASAASLLVNILAITALYLFPAVRRLTPLLLGLLLAFACLAMGLALDLRFLFLKYILAPFVMDDMGNGRLSLLYMWITEYGQAPIRMIGSQATVPPPFFVHNLIFDSMIKDGLIAASALLLFGVFAFVFLLRDFYMYRDKYSFLNLTLLVLMVLPAMFQPVQFSHAFSFLLSISTVGILTSMSVGQPVSGFPRVTHS